MPETAARRLEGAQERIEKFRKGDFVLELRGADGAPLPQGVPVVVVEQSAHGFHFGGSVVAVRRTPASRGNRQVAGAVPPDPRRSNRALTRIPCAPSSTIPGTAGGHIPPSTTSRGQGHVPAVLARPVFSSLTQD